MLQIRAPHPWEPIVEHLPAHHGLSVWWEICPNWNGKPSEGFELGNKAMWFHWNKISVEKSVSVQFSHSVVSDSLRPHEPQHTRPPCPSLTPGVHPTHVHRVGDSIQSSHPLSSPSPPALNLSQHQGLFKWVSSLHQVARVLEFQFAHQSPQWTPRTDLL